MYVLLGSHDEIMHVLPKKSALNIVNKLQLCH